MSWCSGHCWYPVDTGLPTSCYLWVFLLMAHRNALCRMGRMGADSPRRLCSPHPQPAAQNWLIWGENIWHLTSGWDQLCSIIYAPGSSWLRPRLDLTRIDIFTWLFALPILPLHPSHASLVSTTLGSHQHPNPCLRLCV